MKRKEGRDPVTQTGTAQPSTSGNLLDHYGLPAADSSIALPAQRIVPSSRITAADLPIPRSARSLMTSRSWSGVAPLVFEGAAHLATLVAGRDRPP